MTEQDFWELYHKKLGFLNKVNEHELYIRTSTETRTFQVAGGMLYGMDPHTVKQPFKVHNQPANVGDDPSSL
jgi:2-phosphoxylose phosphatase